MEGFAYWFVPVAAMVFGTILILYFYAKKKRKEAFRRMASEARLTYYPNFSSIPVNSRPDPLDFPWQHETKNVRGAVLQGEIGGSNVLVFDYTLFDGNESYVTQTVACFRTDPVALRERFPVMAGSTEVEDWCIQFGAHGWLALYKSRRRVKPGRMRTFLDEANGIAIPPPSLELPDLKWLGPKENPFGVEVLDCRPLTLGLVSSTKDQSIAARFLQLRGSSGEEVRGTQPTGGRCISCDLAYLHKSQAKDGPLFKAEEMEEKWDIYLYDGYLYFARSWTGQLIFRAKVEFAQEAAKVKIIEAGPQDEDEFIVRQVDFLIKSHVLRLEVPHPLPKNPEKSPQWLAVYSYQLYGRRALFGTFADTLALRPPSAAS